MTVYAPTYGTVYGGAAQQVTPGGEITLILDFYDMSTGQPADPDAVQLDITYGTEVGMVVDTAGPFLYAGSSVPAAGQVYRLGLGVYAFDWQVPSGTPSGVYVANWTSTYGGEEWLGTEDFVVSGGPLPPVIAGGAAGDTGFWTGSLSHNGNTVEFGAVDTNGIAWMLNGVDGWDGPDVSGGVIQKSGDHGGWASPQFYAPRNLTLRITASAPSQALRDVARALLSQVVPVSDLALFVYNEPVPKQAQLRRSGKIAEKPLTLTDVQFTVGAVAPDPRKYSAQVHSVTTPAAVTSGIGITFPVTFPITFPSNPPAGQCAVTNAGNFETRPVIVITGPVTSPSLTSLTTGQTVTWPGLTLADGETLTVDFLNHVAFDQNGTYWPASTSSSWWVMDGNAPGGFTTQIELGGAAGAGAQFVTTWMDAWD